VFTVDEQRHHGALAGLHVGPTPLRLGLANVRRWVIMGDVREVVGGTSASLRVRVLAAHDRAAADSAQSVRVRAS
jgi:hypothetical protein